MLIPIKEFISKYGKDIKNFKICISNNLLEHVIEKCEKPKSKGKIIVISLKNEHYLLFKETNTYILLIMDTAETGFIRFEPDADHDKILTLDKDYLDEAV